MATPEMPQKTPYMITLEAGTYFWCACGKSKNQPFCDGAHSGSGMTPVSFSLDEKRQVALCGCKRSDGPPFCDGSHSKL